MRLRQVGERASVIFRILLPTLRSGVLWALFLSILLLWVGISFSQNHPELDWKVVETEHFRIYYHEGLEWFAGQASLIAEEIYGPVTSLYRFEPDEKVRIVLKDYDDLANGAAFFYHNKIEIWATNLEFELRGTHDWLRNALTHEFTHIISLQVARKISRRIPAFFFQYFGYQQESDRSDVLIGFPDVLVSYPLMMTLIPMWFAEGMAQYQAEGARYDSWDTHRDMVLRMAARNGNLLTLPEMGVFEKNGIGNEKVYNQGYSLVRYIAEQYSPDELEQIARKMGDWWRIDFDSAIESVLGISEKELYQAWRTHLMEQYASQTAPIRERLVAGEVLKNQGYTNAYPRWSPDGERVAYLSTKGRDYGPPGLYVLSVGDGEEKTLVGAVTSSLSWSNDGKRLLFCRKHKADKYGSRYWDPLPVRLREGEGTGAHPGTAGYLSGLRTGWREDGLRPKSERNEQPGGNGLLRRERPISHPLRRWHTDLQSLLVARRTLDRLFHL